MHTTDNLRVNELRPLISPNTLLQELPITPSVQQTVIAHRKALQEIMAGQDDRLVVMVGPCSIHDPVSALDFANRLKSLVHKFSSQLCIIMRVYFEKPRTTVGWKGLINDPNLDNSFDINRGLKIARKLLLEINDLGVATGSEFLDTIIPQYISDLTSWAAIGARTTESQIHRELASGLSMPVGFKNSTTGDIQVAIDAVNAAARPHHFLGINKDGVAAIISTAGNQNCHIILRGSNKGPNYDEQTIKHTIALLQKQQLMSRLMIDCSHGNSNKEYIKQIQVIKDISVHLQEKDHPILGVMIESNIVAGQQKLVKNQPLVYGQSITDSCLNFEQTAELLQFLNDTIEHTRSRSK